MEGVRPVDPITDVRADPNSRVEALEQLVTRAGNIAPFLVEQLWAELRREDTSFVIYLFDAIRKTYDRRLVPALVKVLRTRDADVAFRLQCVDVLRELYRHSLASLDRVTQLVQAGRLDDPVVQWFMTRPQPLDEVFSVKGESLLDEDRREIELALRDVAENPREVQPLRDEAQAALGLIWGMKDPTRRSSVTP